MNGVADIILKDRRISYLLVDRSLRIEEVHDPTGLWSDSDLARPGAPLLDPVSYTHLDVYKRQVLG